MLGFFWQWPTLLSLIMLPVLILMYTQLAKDEENDSQKEFGELWNEYAEKTTAFIPRRKKINS